MQITINTLKRLARSLIATLFVMSLTACEQPATLIAQVGEGARSEAAVSFRARIVGVTDGDTVTALDEQDHQHKIRLAEIDAPERGQPWGDRSRQALAALVFGKMVSVQQTDTDRYGRVVARVFSNGLEVNRTMVEQGDAWAYRRYLTDQTLIATEARARQQRVGLWSLGGAQTVPPWEWRKGVRIGPGSSGETVAATRPRSLIAPKSKLTAQSTGDGFSCSGKRYCRQMGSCAEANFYLRQCGVLSLDGNSDGEPCEVLCGTVSR